MPALLDSATRTARAGVRRVRHAVRRARVVADAAGAITPRTEDGTSADAPTSAAGAVWISARHDGARSASVYEQALRAAFAIDAARSELGCTRQHRVRAAGATRPAPTSATTAAGPDRAVLVIGPDPVSGPVGEPDVEAILLCYAGARATIRSLCLAAACAGVRRDATVAPLIKRVCVVSCMVDPAHNPLLGQLAATPTRAARSLVEGEPLIRDGRLAYGDAEVDLDDLDRLADLLQAATLATLARAPTRLGRLRDAAARAR